MARLLPFSIPVALLSFTILLLTGCRGGQAEPAPADSTPDAPPSGAQAENSVPPERYQDPDGLVPLEEVAPDIVQEMRYAGAENFMGRKVDGYAPGMSIRMLQPAALALAAVQGDLSSRGLGLKVYDAYRPQTAVDHFVRWSMDPADTLRKAAYYPDLDKPELFEKGYIARISSHTTGATVDLTIVDPAQGGAELDMGSPFDFFGPRSHHGASGLTPEQEQNRLLLRSSMEARGFSAYENEWWHYRWTAPEGGS